MSTSRVVIVLSVLTALSVTSLVYAQTWTCPLPEETYCDACHPLDSPTTWISVTEVSEDESGVTIYVTGSDNYNGEEARAVFDPYGWYQDVQHNDGNVWIPKDGTTWRVYWVDSGITGNGGSAYEEFTYYETPPPVPEFPYGVGLIVLLAPLMALVHIWRVTRARKKPNSLPA